MRKYSTQIFTSIYRRTCLTAISSEVSILIHEYTVPNFPAPTTVHKND